MTASPDATVPPTAPTEAAWRRAHPELATLATAQIRESMAIEARLRQLSNDEAARRHALRIWCEEHGIYQLPLAGDEPTSATP